MVGVTNPRRASCRRCDIGQRQVIDDARARRESAAAQHQHDVDRDIAASQARHAEQLENLRFVRQLSTQPDTPRPFAGLDLQGQNLAGLDLRGACLNFANLQDVQLLWSDLSSTPAHYTQIIGGRLSGADLLGAKLTKADLIGATLTGADLTGIYYDEKTKWPVGFKPPPPAKP